METAIERIVAAYVRLKNRRALEQLRIHRHRIAVDLKMRSGYDFSLLIQAIDEEIAAIDAGLERLSEGAD